MTNFVARVADTLDFTSGFASPSLAYDATAASHDFDEDGRRAWRTAMRLAVRHPGLEIQLPAIELDDRCHGAHWQTLLGPALIARLGGRDAIRSAADAAGLRVDAFARGVRLWASTSPHVGDSLASDLPDGLCRLARLLREVTTLTSRWWTTRPVLDLFDDGEGPRFEHFAAEVDAGWQARLLDGGRRLEPQALALDQLNRLERLARSMGTSPGSDWDELLGQIERAPYWSRALLDAAAALLATTWTRGERRHAERLLAAFATPEGALLARSKALLEHTSSGELIPWLAKTLSSALEPRERGRWLCALGLGVAAQRPELLGDVVSELPPTLELGARYDLVRAASLAIMGPFQLDDFETAARRAAAAEPLANRFPSTFSFQESETTGTEEGFRNLEQGQASNQASLCAWMAAAYTKCGRFDDALRSLERALEHGDSAARLDSVDAFEPLRADPRYVRLVRARLG